MRYLLVLLGLLVTGTAEAMDCRETPDCSQMGYSTASDPNCKDDGYIYCPFDKTYKKCVNMNCEALGFTQSDKTSWCNKLIKCKSDTSYTLCQNLCEVGDVYYADGSCGKAEKYEPNSSPEPVGVVYWLKDNGAHGKVINLHDLGKSSNNMFNAQDPYNTSGSATFVWGDYAQDIPDLKNWECEVFTNVALTGQRADPLWSGGKSYTDIIATFQKENLQYPAAAAKAFYPPNIGQDDPKIGAGHWYLPTIGELMDLYGQDFSNLGTKCENVTTGATGKIIEKVNTTLKALKGKNVKAEELNNHGTTEYWSSSEYNATTTWGICMTNGQRDHTQKKFDGNYVRVSLEF